MESEYEVTLEADKSDVVDDLPFNVLVLGDWLGDGQRAELRKRSPIEIDRDNFDEVMARFGVRLDLRSDDGISLEFNCLDDFHPDEIFRQVPLFSELRDLRKRLSNSDTFVSAAREASEKFGQAEPAREIVESPRMPEAASDPSESLLDSILAKPSGGDRPAADFRSREIKSFISEVIGPHIVSVNEDQQAASIAAVDSAIGDVMRGILHDRRFQELEAAWRGLHFLVRRTETSTELKIFVFDITKAELESDLRSSDELRSAAAGKLLTSDLNETWSVVCGNYSFSPNVDDIAALIRLGKLCHMARAPFISHMRPDVLGIDSLSEHGDPAYWRLSHDSEAAKLWFALRSQPQAASLGFVLPRFLARLPYGEDTEPLETFAFEEFTAVPVHDEYLWANPCFAAAALLTRSFAELGWEMGTNLRQDLEGLPLYMYKRDSEKVYTPCAEALLSQNAAQEILDRGLMPLVTYKNTDRIRLLQFRSASEDSPGFRCRWT